MPEESPSIVLIMVDDMVYSDPGCYGGEIKTPNIEWMDAERFRKVWQFTGRANDQSWAVTDCFSFWIMKELNMSEALTKDSHFENAGFFALLA